MTTMSIYGKTPLKYSSWNQWADFDETWYEASETEATIVCSNNNPGLTFSCLTAMSNIATLAFTCLLGNVIMVDF